jgi:hypothetical protein
VSNASTAHVFGNVDPARLHTRVRPLGNDLSDAFRRLFEAIPGAPHRPTLLARQLGLSRVTVSKLLNAIARPNPYEVLEQVPGPESLRALTRAASGLGVAARHVDEANRVIDSFASLIRHDFGTRSAFNAAITPQRPESKRRFENANRYQVYMGMRQILGVEADTWLMCMLFAPVPGSDDLITVTTIHGALGMRRLRPDVGVYFTFGPPPQLASEPPDISRSPIGLQEFYTHDPAPFETHMAGGQLIHRLAHDRLGRRATVDMLAVCQDARGSRRYATPDRPRGGLAMFPEVPVKTLICDALLYDGVFPGAQPELLVYNPRSRGPANPDDRLRDIDRIEAPEHIQALGKADDRFIVPEVPKYDEMITQVCSQIRHNPSRFRVFRLRMVYPVCGFQVVMAFGKPPKPR